MGSKIIVVAFLALFCKVNSQLCGPPPLAPQIVTTQAPVVATTIVDNSVSNALANALQLLIVSDLIDSKLGPLAAGNLLNNMGPIVESITTPFGSAIEVLPQVKEYISPYGNVEIMQPCGTPIVETIQPNIFGGYTETFSPLYRPSPAIIERFQPAPYAIAEPFPPCRNGPIVDRIQPNIYGGYTETISPLYGNGPIVEKFQPNIFGGITETLSSLYSPQLVEQFLPKPYYTEVCNDFYGPEIVPVTPNFYERITEVVPPTAQFLPNYYGGMTEVITPPMAAEVLFPASIPAQLTCNFGYNLPSNSPCVNVNVETLPFESTFPKNCFC